MKKRTLALLAVIALMIPELACSDSAPLDTPDKEVCLMRRDGARYCIDQYEASRRDATKKTSGRDNKSPPRSLPGVLPWSMVNWGEAVGACMAKNKRLCEADEWIDACDGVVGMGGTKYTYGDVLDPTRCNVQSRTATTVATGTIATCMNPSTHTFDQSGNLWEWTGNVKSAAAARGGGYGSNVLHACDTDSMGAFDPDVESVEVGFRCCRP